MIYDNDITLTLQTSVLQAIESKQSMMIHGGNTKHFYGNEIRVDRTLDMSAHQGIISYEPSELYVTVRAGTPIAELEKVLAEHYQLLPFEPPVFSSNSTIGGAIAAGLSGPRRMFGGSLRDCLLGVTLINGYGKVVRFGGQVIKNVAGYDVSRLMAGSMGSLGVILDVSLKVLPMPEQEVTLVIKASNEKAITLFNQWRPMPIPISASCYVDGLLYVRLSGGKAALSMFKDQINGDELPNGDVFWSAIRNQTHAFFNENEKPLWRLSLPPSTPIISRLEENSMIDWNGAQRWLYSNVPAHIIRSIAEKHQGNATLFKGELPGVNKFMPLTPALTVLHQRLKRKLDPNNVFGVGRLYRDF